jgi:hypothetical protein
MGFTYDVQGIDGLTWEELGQLETSLTFIKDFENPMDYVINCVHEKALGKYKEEHDGELE